MAQAVEKEVVIEEPVSTCTKLINAKLITVIPNSRAEHSVYTYHTEVDAHSDIMSADFYHPLYTFVKSGDILRIFKYDDKKELKTYYELIVADVDSINKKVKVSLLNSKNIEKYIL